MMSARRQNSSCDQCRRSKRKCIFTPADPRDVVRTCLNCTALGSDCTFVFITARIEERKRRLRQSGSESRTPAAKRHNQVQALCSDRDDEVQPTNLAVSTEEIQTSQFDLFSSVDFSVDDLGEGWNFSMPECAGLGSYTPSTSANSQYTPGLWSGSPIQLLNSTITSSLWGDYLDEIYISMMNGIESRYLTYTCNLYSPNNKYSFGDGEGEEEDESTPLSGNINTMPPSDCSSLLGSTETKSRQITFVGLARFLDHFGQLYGNKLDRQTKLEDEETLVLVKSAFALQWLDCGDSSPKGSPACSALDDGPRSQSNGANNARFFATAWFNARSRILNTSPHRSFTRVYTIFLFHITNPPAEAKDVSQEMNDLLHRGLQEFMVLKRGVEDFCDHMSPTSTYRMLLQSAIKIFHWFGYVRDTMASIVFDRECILEDAPLRPGIDFPSISPPVIDWSSNPLKDAGIPAICQQAIRRLFCIFRQSIHLRKTLQDFDTDTDVLGITVLVNEGFNTIEEFEYTYSQFCEKCTSEFHRLSRAAKVSSAFIVLFWTLGVLSFAEQVLNAHRLGIISPTCEVKINRAQKTVLNAASAISKNIVNLSATGQGKMAVANGSVTKLPLISHHANLLLVVKVLVSAIENTIQMNTSSSVGLGQAVPAESWMPSMKPLLSCLLELDVTVAGSNTARKAVQKLMSSHSDILMDCWSVQNDDILSGSSNPTNEIDLSTVF